MSSLRQYVRNIAALTGQAFTQRLFGMLSTVVLARVLGVSSFGAYSVVSNTASSAYGMVRLGVDASIQVHTAESDRGENSRQDKGNMLGAGLLLLLGSAVVAAVATLLLSDWLAKTVYGQPELARWMNFAAGLVLLQCLSQFCFATLAGLHQFVAYSRIMALSAVVSTLAVSIGAYSFGISGALVGMLGAQATTVLLLAGSVRGGLDTSGILLRLGDVKQWIYRHLRFGFPFYAAGLLSVPVGLYVQGLLSRHAGLEALGNLRVITAILTLISFIPTSVASATLSLLTGSSTSDYSSFIQQSLFHIKWVWVFALFSGLGMFLVLPLIVKLLFGRAYVGAVAPASYAILTTIISCVLVFSSSMILSRRRVGLILAMTTCQVTVFAGVASMLIPRMGLSGYFAAELSGYVTAVLFICYNAASWMKRHDLSISWLVLGMLLSVIDGVGLLFLSLPIMQKYRVMGMILLMIATAYGIYRFVLDAQDHAFVTKLTRRILGIEIGGIS